MELLPAAFSLSSITLFCPSRGRPKDAQALKDTFDLTAEHAKLVFLVDDDDPSDYGPNVQRGLGTGDPTGPLNRAALTCESDIVGFCGDDTRFLTSRWDVMVEMQEPGFVWGYDGHDKPWPSTVFMPRSFIQALGYMVPPTLRRGYFDVAWCELAGRTGTTRIIEAAFIHDNSRGDPSSKNFDPAYQVPPSVIRADALAYSEWLKWQMPKDVQKLRHTIYSR